MARSRVIKPEFWTDEKIGEIPRDSKLLFIGLWCLSDDYGVVRASERYIKGQLFAYDDCTSSQIKGWLAILEEKRMIIKFDSNGESYYYIRTFRDHQKIHNPSKTRNPEPPEGILVNIPRKSEEIGNNPVETETETEFKQKLETETITTSATSDKKPYRLPQKESDVSTGLPINTTPEVATGLPDKKGDTLTEQSPVQPDVFLELPDKTSDEFTEPSLGRRNGEIKGMVKPLPKNEKISFDYETGKFTSVTEAHIGRWKEAYPAVEVLTELRQMAVWADTNRKNRKSDWQRFIINWLKRSQDRARPAAPSWKGGGFGQFGNSKPTHAGEAEEPKGKYADQVDEIIYTDA